MGRWGAEVKEVTVNGVLVWSQYWAVVVFTGLPAGEQCGFVTEQTGLCACNVSIVTEILIIPG